MFVFILLKNNFRHQIRVLKASLCASSLVFGCLPDHSQPSGDSRGGEALTDRMDNGEYHISTVDNMDTTLAELGDEFTLGDIDGELDICSICLVK